MVVGPFKVMGACPWHRITLLAVLALGFSTLACAPEPDGAVVFAERCAGCHLDPLFPRAPPVDMMQGWNPGLIVAALSSNGLMQEQGAGLSTGERTAVAEYISLGAGGDRLAGDP